jgi:hypothetical protein
MNAGAFWMDAPASFSCHSSRLMQSRMECGTTSLSYADVSALSKPSDANSDAVLCKNGPYHRLLTPACLATADKAIHDGGGFLVHGGQDMRVDGHGDRHVGVPEHLRYLLHEDAIGEQERRRGVPQVVNADPG